MTALANDATLDAIKRRRFMREQFAPLPMAWKERVWAYLNFHPALEDQDLIINRTHVKLTRNEYHSLMHIDKYRLDYRYREAELRAEGDNERELIKDKDYTDMDRAGSSIPAHKNIRSVVTDTYVRLACKYRNEKGLREREEEDLSESNEPFGNEDPDLQARNPPNPPAQRIAHSRPVSARTVVPLPRRPGVGRPPRPAGATRRGGIPPQPPQPPTGPAPARKKRRPQAPPDLPRKRTLRSHTTKSQQPEQDPYQPSCISFGSETTTGIDNNRADRGEVLRNCQRELDRQGVRGEKLRKLDYLMIPYHDYLHHVLLGIAPKQKFFFMMSSTVYDEWCVPTFRPIRLLLDLGMSELGDDITRGGDPWPIYGQWSKRTQTADRSPDIPQQSDGCNCGIFTSSNATNLAFGYDLLCYTELDLVNRNLDGKRPRMAAEFINGGIRPPFRYRLFDIPTELQNIRPPFQAPKAAGRRNQRGARTKVRAKPIDKANGGKSEEDGANEPKEGKWPAQFDPQQTKRAGFLYPITNPRFAELKTKKELLKACREQQIPGHTSASELPIDVFRRWMENYKAAEDYPRLPMHPDMEKADEADYFYEGKWVTRREEEPKHDSAG